MIQGFSEFVSESAHRALTMYAKKSGGVDKGDMLAIADMIKKKTSVKDLAMMIRAMDTDPRDGVLQTIQKSDKKLYNDLVKNMR